MPVVLLDALAENRVEALRSFHQKVGTTKAELDLSGGVDSAVMLGLLRRAGLEVTAVFSQIHSNPEALERARECADTFDTHLHVIDLREEYESILAKITSSLGSAGVALLVNPLTLGALRSTLRAPVGRAFNRFSGGGIRHGTGNECEDRWLRFYQKGGDGEVDTNPISMLSKGEVYQLAWYLKVPRSILTASPSPDLWGIGDAHSDESEISDYMKCPLPEGASWYGYIDPDSGELKNIGFIERISRAMDVLQQEWSPNAVVWRPGPSGRVQGYLPVTLTEEGERFYTRAQEIEAQTRHKANPNIPALGRREDLVKAGILLNDLGASSLLVPR